MGQEETRIRDEEQLRLLGTFHYVVAGVEAAFGVLSLLNLALGLAMLREGSDFFGAGPPMPEFFGPFMVATSILYFIGGLGFAALTFAAGRRLRALRSRRFVVVAAAINCIAFPFGTILGVFTLVVLNRDSVRAMFES